MTVYDEMLGDMQGMRKALVLRFKWHCHVTPIANADSIRSNGLMPKSDKAAPENVRRLVAGDSGKIICLNPLGADMAARGVQRGTLICLALLSSALPPRLGLDWSYAGATGIAETLREEDCKRPAGEIFVESVNRWGSVVAYDPIPATALRCYAIECAPHDPKNWPLLVDTPNGSLQTFIGSASTSPAE